MWEKEEENLRHRRRSREWDAEDSEAEQQIRNNEEYRVDQQKG